jgi:hypothetical protein
VKVASIHAVSECYSVDLKKYMKSEQKNLKFSILILIFNFSTNSPYSRTLNSWTVHPFSRFVVEKHYFVDNGLISGTPEYICTHIFQ